MEPPLAVHADGAEPRRPVTNPRGHRPTLHPASYDWRFVPVALTFTDRARDLSPRTRSYRPAVRDRDGEGGGTCRCRRAGPSTEDGSGWSTRGQSSSVEGWRDSIAYHLAERGWTDTVLVERPTSRRAARSTPRSRRQLRSSVTLTKMMMYGVELTVGLATDRQRSVVARGRSPGLARAGRFDNPAPGRLAKTFGLPLESSGRTRRVAVPALSTDGVPAPSTC
jgi:hypothetical protein